MTLPLIVACLVAGSAWSSVPADQTAACNPKTDARPYLSRPTSQARLLARKRAVTAQGPSPMLQGGTAQGITQGSAGVLALGGSDSCSTPDVIAGSGTFAFDNTLATTGIEGQSEVPCYSYGSTAITHDVWFAWTASSAGTATFSLCGGASMDSKIAAYAGSACPAAGTALACNDDSCSSLQSTIDFTVTSGGIYLLQLGAFPQNPGSWGTFTLDVVGGGGGGPANDNCWSATPISGNGTFAFDDSTATTGLEGQSESLCFFFGGTAITRDIWFAWTAPGTGTAVFSLCGGTFMDSKIAVYAGASCPTPGNAIACNDDYCLAPATQSQLSFPCTAGSTYMLQLGTTPYSATGSTGSFTINAGGGTANDDCATPAAITGLGAFNFDDTLATTGSAGQSESLCNFLFTTVVFNDVWYAWTAPSSGTATLALCGGTGMDSKVAAYAGTSCPVTGTALACNDDYFACPTLQSSIFFPVTAGSSYMLQIGTSLATPGSAGTFTLNVGYVGPPANDDCSTAEPISGVGTFNFDTLNATTGPQQGLSCFQGESRQDVWYDWTCPMTGVAQWSLCNGAPFDTLVAVYAGSSCPAAGSALLCDDDGCGLYGPHIYTSQCAFDVTAGNHYMLQLGAALPGPTYAGSGTFELEVAPVPGPCTAWDDGTSDSLVGWLAGGDMVWMSRFGEPGVSTTINAVEVAWGSAFFPGLNPGNGTPTDVFIWQDVMQFGNPAYATLLLSIPTTVSLVDTDTYVTFPIAPLTITGYFFVGSHQDHQGSSGGGQGQFVAPFDDTSHVFTNVSWFFGNNSGFGSSPVDYANPNNNVQWPVSFDSQGYVGQAMLRVSCSGTPATYVCDPGSGSTSACPCANPPSGTGRGCDNKGATGGASISASGSNSLTTPTLVFTTANENATVGSVLIQGTTLSVGVTFGHGVRCAAGLVKRLYIKGAVGGSITAPVFPTDLDIPSRSAALGDPLTAGQTRWYQVYYRDTTVLLPGCPALAGQFNTTNAAEVSWLP